MVMSLALVWLCAGLSWATAAQALSCVVPAPPFARGLPALVFDAVAGESSGGPLDRSTRLRVTKVYRGTVPAIVDAKHGGLEGYGLLVPGQRYLVLGSLRGDTKDSLFVGYCSATHQRPSLPAEAGRGSGRPLIGSGRCLGITTYSFPPRVVAIAERPEAPLEMGKAGPLQRRLGAKLAPGVTTSDSATA